MPCELVTHWAYTASCCVLVKSVQFAGVLVLWLLDELELAEVVEVVDVDELDVDSWVESLVVLLLFDLLAVLLLTFVELVCANDDALSEVL